METWILVHSPGASEVVWEELKITVLSNIKLLFEVLEHMLRRM